MPASSVADSETRSINSFASSFSQRSFFGRLNKYELKRRFYEKLDDFKNKVLLHKEQGFIVYRARCVYSGGVVVLKGYSRESLTLQTRQRVFCEVTLLQRAQCPFILKCFDSFEDQGWWWLVLENCAAGDLYHVVQQTGPVRSEGWLVSQVLLPILQTLAYLHAEGIIHRDIKPEHVLFNSEKVAKLSGFFLSWDVNRFSLPKDMVGTLDYVAPEVFIINGPNAKQQSLTHYDYKVDIWGVGVMTYDVLVGSPPFNSDDPNTTVENILLREVEYPDFLSDDAVDFIDQCLTKDPAKRPTARQLLSHPWVRNHLDWEAPDDFEDPIPNIDFSYYRVAGAAGEDLEGESEEEDDGRRWYNPTTWLRRRNSLDELLNGEPETPSNAKEGNRAAWRLTQSITGFAKNFGGAFNRGQVNPEPPPPPSMAAREPGAGAGADGASEPAGGTKVFSMLPGRSKSKDDLLSRVDEDDEDDDPEAAHTAAATTPTGAGAGRVSSPPPRPVPPLHLNGAPVTQLGSPSPSASQLLQPPSQDDLTMTSARSVDGGGTSGKEGAAAGAAAGLPPKAPLVLPPPPPGGSGSGSSVNGSTPKAPAFLPHPAARPPSAHADGGEAAGGASPSPAPGAGPAGGHSHSPSPVPRRFSPGPGDTAAVRRTASSRASNAPSDAPAGRSTPPPPAADAGDAVQAIGGSNSGAGEAPRAALQQSGSKNGRPAPHLSPSVIKGHDDEASASADATHATPTTPWMVANESLGGGAAAAGSPPERAGSSADGGGPGAMPPVMPPGSNKTTPREREEVHRLTGTEEPDAEAPAAGGGQ